MKLRRRTAFSIIDLLVVTGIIGLLVAILLPAAGSAREQARALVCLSNLRQLGVAQTAYLGENEGRFPNKWIPAGGTIRSQFSWVGKAGAPGYGYNTLTPRLRPLNKYLALSKEGSDAGVALCPGDQASRNAIPLSSFDYHGTSYAQNQATETTTVQDYRHTLLEPGNILDVGIRSQLIKNPSRVVSIAELGAYHDGWTFAQPTIVVQRWHGKSPKFNLLFVDGHAGTHEVLTEHRGATADYTFYLNK